MRDHTKFPERVIDFFLPRVGLALFAAFMIYLTLFPLAFRCNFPGSPGLFWPMARLLDGPWQGATERYLQLWGVEPDCVRCACPRSLNPILKKP